MMACALSRTTTKKMEKRLPASCPAPPEERIQERFQPSLLTIAQRRHYVNTPSSTCLFSMPARRFLFSPNLLVDGIVPYLKGEKRENFALSEKRKCPIWFSHFRIPCHGYSFFPLLLIYSIAD